MVAPLPTRLLSMLPPVACRGQPKTHLGHHGGGTWVQAAVLVTIVVRAYLPSIAKCCWLQQFVLLPRERTCLALQLLGNPMLCPPVLKPPAFQLTK